MPLSSLALSVIEDEYEAHEPLVFPLSKLSGAEMTAWSHFNKSGRNSSGVSNFILHDLRRTFSNLMAENSDVSENIIDSLLNHKQSVTRRGVMAHYQKAKHLEKRRAVMTQWSQLLEAWL